MGDVVTFWLYLLFGTDFADDTVFILVVTVRI